MRGTPTTRRALLLVFGVLGAAALFGPHDTVEAKISKAELRARQAEAAARVKTKGLQRDERDVTTSPRLGDGRVKNITFSDPRASEFYVDGRSIPDVDWDIGPSWSGLLPISDDPGEQRKLFFWFFPPGPMGSPDDFIFWMNGGPGCSSLEGLLQEIGPFQWQWGQARPTPNEFSWTNLSSVLFVEQPIGVGYSQGVSNFQDEEELVEQLVGFMQQFLEVFRELRGKKLYLTGESYAGMYIPYLANYMYDHPAALNLSLTGIALIDPVMGYDLVQTQIPAVDYVHKFEQVFAFNQSFLAHIDAVAERCGFAGYVEKYVTFPPPRGPFPLPGDGRVEVSPECNVWDEIMYAALAINPAFNVFRVFDTWPILWDVLGYPGTYPNVQSPIYFDREDVKRAIHAPLNVTWTDCIEEIFADYVDRSEPSSHSVLPRVIERSERAVIVHGLADFDLIADGTRILIQNMTWNGLQGFQKPIEVDSFVVDGMGALGSTHTERGLTYFEVALAGHMVPQFSPKASFQIMEYLLGFRKTPSQKPSLHPRIQEDPA